MLWTATADQSLSVEKNIRVNICIASTSFKPELTNARSSTSTTDRAERLVSQATDAVLDPLDSIDNTSTCESD
jgi:hypothetical protein